MKIRIYQVNMERDSENLAFMGSDFVMKKHGDLSLDSSIYDSVFEGTVECRSLEDVYDVFNKRHPTGYKARSLSVSDVVEVLEAEKVKKGFYFCDSFGFKEVSFDPTKAQQSERFCDYDQLKTIEVLLVQPDKAPQLIRIEDSLAAMQAVVGGDIEEYMPFSDEVALICNEEGKVNGLPLNRAIYAEPVEVDMTYQEMKNHFREVEKECGEHITGYIVFSQDSFTKPYSLESRTYVVSSDNKAFQPNKGGYSIFAEALDGTDQGVRLEQYMAEEYGGKDGWKVERCYMKNDSREMLDIIAGDFFIVAAPIESERFESLTPEQVKKYQEKFKNPERFFRTESGIAAVPYKPVSKEMER